MPTLPDAYRKQPRSSIEEVTKVTKVEVGFRGMHEATSILDGGLAGVHTAIHGLS